MVKTSRLELIKALASQSDHPLHKHGCIITYKGRVISKGFNQMKTHPKVTHPWKNTHAEFNAIAKARRDLEGCEIYVYREHKNGTLANSKPCDYCMELIKRSGIHKIHFTDDNKWSSITL